MVAAAQRGRNALAMAEQIGGATRRQRGQHGEPERTGDLARGVDQSRGDTRIVGRRARHRQHRQAREGQSAADPK